MLHSKQTTYNFYDYFIISIIASTIIGIAQMGLISHTFVAGLLCLPLALLEVASSFKAGKIRPISIWFINRTSSHRSFIHLWSRRFNV